MVSVSRAAHSIEVTAESLQEDLARLQIQKQALERELAAVAAHLSSVQRALSALEGLMTDPADGPPADTDHAGPVGTRQTPAPRSSRTDTPHPVTADTAAKSTPSKRPAGKEPETARPAASAGLDDQRTYGKLTEQILEYFAGVGDADVRARDVAAALGRDTDSGAINAVRSTLDRLVGTSRVLRSGRGLYRRAERG